MTDRERLERLRMQYDAPENISGKFRRLEEGLAASAREWEREALAIAEAVRQARTEQERVERDRVSVARRAPPIVTGSGGMTFPSRPRR